MTGPLCGESTNHWSIPLTQATDMEFWFFLSVPEQTAEQTNRGAGDLRHHQAHCDVTVLYSIY